MEFLQYPLAFIVTLGLLVTIHEAGHYVVARWSGVTIQRFSVGMGRALWRRVDRRGTEFVLAAIPLGGYVRMLDERELPEGQRLPAGAVAFNQLTPAWRIAIAAAGPLANFLLAGLVFWIMAVLGTSNAAPVLGAMDEDAPIAEAGAQPGSEIVAVDGEVTRSWQQVSVALASRLGETGVIRFALKRPGAATAQEVSVPITNWHQGESDPSLLESLGINYRLPPVIGLVVDDAPAANAGVKVGDVVTAIDGEPVSTWRDFVAAVQAAPDQALALRIDRAGTVLDLEVRPAAQDGSSTGFLGVGPPINTVRFGPIAAVGEAVKETAAKTALTLGLLKKMIFGQVSVQNLSGPITIAEVAGSSARLGLVYFLGVLALLSISLGIMNLLPIPILDGGHIIWAAAEWVRGRPVPDQVQLLGTQVGLLLVGSLMLLALYNDFSRLLQ